MNDLLSGCAKLTLVPLALQVKVCPVENLLPQPKIELAARHGDENVVRLRVRQGGFALWQHLP